VFAQNHDQIGNRRLGERLSGAVTLEDVKLACRVDSTLALYSAALYG
jgi:1,4-alpha-glucan branching enzyme